MEEYLPSKIKSARCNQFFPNLKSLQESGQYCDFNFTLSGLKIPCHCVILAAEIPHLEINDTRSMDVSQFSTETINIIISAVYHSAYDLDLENITELLELCTRWRLHSLEHKCQKYLLEHISSDNVCALFNKMEAKKHGKAWYILGRYIRKDFINLHKKGRIVDLSISSLCDILEQDEKDAISEEIIFQCAMAAIEREPGSTDATRCYQLIRYEYLSHEYLVDVVMFHPLMAGEQQRESIKRAMKSPKNDMTHGNSPHPAQKMSVSATPSKNTNRSFKYKRAISKEFVEWIGFVDIDGNVLLSDKTKNSFHTVSSLPAWVNSKCSMTSFLNVLCIVGGGMLAIVDFDTSVPIVHIHPDIPTNVNNAGLVNTGVEIFVLGGHRNNNTTTNKSSSVSKYNIKDKVWTGATAMPKPVNAPLTIMHGKSIYVLGGFPDERHVQEYNVTSNTWRERAEMPQGCCRQGAGVVVFEGHITVITPEERMTYMHTDDRWRYHYSGNSIKRVDEKVLVCDDVQAVVLDKEICVLSKDDQSGHLWCNNYGIHKHQELPKAWATEYCFVLEKATAVL